MKDKNTMNRLKAFEQILKEQKEERVRQIVEGIEADDDNSDLIADMLMEISHLLSKAAELSAQAAELIIGGDIEADCCFPCCVVEVFCDDEL